MSKQAETKSAVVINPQHYNFKQFQTRNILMRINQGDRSTWVHVPSETLSYTSSVTHQIKI